jgi:hypothetical protein
MAWRAQNADHLSRLTAVKRPAQPGIPEAESDAVYRAFYLEALSQLKILNNVIQGLSHRRSVQPCTRVNSDGLSEIRAVRTDGALMCLRGSHRCQHRHLQVSKEGRSTEEVDLRTLS